MIPNSVILKACDGFQGASSRRLAILKPGEALRNMRDLENPNLGSTTDVLIGN
jgi:hypothetical protein